MTKPKQTPQDPSLDAMDQVNAKGDVDAGGAGPSQPVLHKKELIDLVVDRSGGKRKDVKPAVEAVLVVLGEALADGREMNLRPFGKIKVTRQMDKPNGTVTVCRVRQPKETALPSTDAAPAGEAE